MLTKNRSNSSAFLKCLLALPLVGLMLFTFSCSKNEKNDAKAASLAPQSRKTGIELKKWADSITTADLKEAYYDVDEIPEFPGGNALVANFIGSNLKYPKEATAKKIEGKVYVKFIVEEDGQVDHVAVASQPNPDFDQAAVDVVKKMPRWSPGKKGGFPVKVWFVVPVSFKL